MMSIIIIIHYVWEVTDDTLALVASKGVKGDDEKVIDFLLSTEYIGV